MSQPQITFNADELKQAAAHLAFDAYHFHCYSRIRSENVLLGHPACPQAVMYALLIHVRVLVDFFFNKPKDDDCCLVHFREVFPSFAAAFPAQITTPTLAEVRELKRNLNKRLAHLTATRWREPQPVMADYEKHFAAIDKVVEAFRDALPTDVQDVFLERWSFWERNHPVKLS